MKFFTTLLALPSLALCAPAISPEDDFSSVQIVGGMPAAAGDFPSIIAFYYEGLFNCGGSLLNANTVLTAAHCVVNRVASGMTIRVGSLSKETGGIVANVSSFKMHPGYVTATQDNDVAILKLSTDIAQSASISYAKLAPTNFDPTPGALLTVAGWGLTKPSGDFSPVLLKVDVPVVSRAQCQTSYRGQLVSENMICAGFAQGGKDSCSSDSGGPLVDSSKTVIGVVSWGQGCAEAGFPGVYARVGTVLDFINSSL
ncbi:unnamed protein product [Periconia digitata]|uniref:Peptidase S1 domain-containing protein n=1 Tax=Periconia digitata TaxID=1303443 RepID=A0A9W4XJY1_9PLEO|nr:unnamed protein product [Periconia digitata]